MKQRLTDVAEVSVGGSLVRCGIVVVVAPDAGRLAGHLLVEPDRTVHAHVVHRSAGLHSRRAEHCKIISSY